MGSMGPLGYTLPSCFDQIVKIFRVCWKYSHLCGHLGIWKTCVLRSLDIQCCLHLLRLSDKPAGLLYFQTVSRITQIENHWIT